MKNNKGFSLVELIIVIAIMAVLIGVLAPQYLKYVEKSRVSSDKTAISNVREAMVTSLADEDIYVDVKNNDSVVINASGQIVAGTSCPDKLLKAVKAVVGSSSLSLGSKTYKGSAWEFKATYSTDDMTWGVSALEDSMTAGPTA